MESYKIMCSLLFIIYLCPYIVASYYSSLVTTQLFLASTS